MMMLRWVKMVTYKEANDLLQGKGIVNLGANTKLKRIENDLIGIQLHNTVIVTINQKDEYRLFTGGFRTATTRNRLNQYAPVKIRQLNGQWFIGGKIFEEGMVVRYEQASSLIDNFLPEPPKNLLIEKYVNDFVDYAEKHGLFVKVNEWSVVSLNETIRLGHKDCAFCFNASCVPDKKCEIPKEHILDHMKKGEFVPSLLYKAFDERSSNPALMWSYQARLLKQKKSDDFRKMLSNYLQKVDF